MVKSRRIEQRTLKALKGMPWAPLKERSRHRPEIAAHLDALGAKTLPCARAWKLKSWAARHRMLAETELMPAHCPALSAA